MISESKAASDTKLQRCDSPSSFIPLKCISSIDSNRIGKYRSGNNIPSTKKFGENSSEHLVRSINEHENFIQTHFPIANIPQDCTISSRASASYQSPTVPKQAGTFLHRLVNKFLSMTDTKQKKSHARQRQKKVNVPNNTYVTTKKRRRQPLKSMAKKNHIHRNYLPNVPPDSLECLSSVMLNSNALTTSKSPPILIQNPSRIPLENTRTLNPSQCQTIASAVQLIFNTLIFNYQSI